MCIRDRYTDQADAFDGLFNMVLGYGIQFLLPCIIGVIAAILFFMERDNDTFKNLGLTSGSTRLRHLLLTHR